MMRRSGRAIPSRRHSSADAVLTTQADTTIRTFSSAEYCLRVLRRISHTVRLAVSLELVDFLSHLRSLRPRR